MLNKFGERLKQLRELNKFTQERLALESNISQSQIARSELKLQNTSISHVAAYAKAMNIDAKDFFDFSNLPDPVPGPNPIKKRKTI